MDRNLKIGKLYHFQSTYGIRFYIDSDYKKATGSFIRSNIDKIVFLLDFEYRHYWRIKIVCDGFIGWTCLEDGDIFELIDK